MVGVICAAALVLTACAPATVGSVDVEPTLAADRADSEGGDAERAASEAAASEAARAASEASEQAAEARASEEAAAKAAEEEAARIAAEEAAAKAAEEEAARIAAEEEAARIAAEEEAARIAAEEAAAKAAEEEARRLAEEEDRKNRVTQTTLKELGYYGGAVDGDAGRVTIAAVKDFQSVNGLKVDGVVGPQTEAALASDSAKPKPPPPPTPTPKPAPDDGATTELPPDGMLSVTDAKRVLTDLKYYGGEVNGDASASFRTALTAFQKVEGLGADGVLGPNTSARLRAPSTPSLQGGESNRIEIDLTKQVIHVVKGGVRIRTMPTSSGNGETYLEKDGDTAVALTPVGTFRIERRITGIREADLGILYDPLYFYKGWAIHGSKSVPSYPASHGCTRVSLSDIKWLAAQMPNGTQVRIYGGTHVFTP